MFDYSVNFTAIDSISSKIDKINAKIAGLKQKAIQASKKMNIAGKVRLKTKEAFANLKRLEDRIKGMATKSIVMGGAGIYGMKKFLDEARSYESSWKDVKKAVDGAGEGLRKWAKDYDLGTFSGITEVMANAGRMGISKDDIKGFVAPIMEGAIALDFDPSFAVASIGEILGKTNQLKDATSATKELMDKYVNLENTTAGVIATDIIDIMGRNAGLFKQIDLSNTDMAGISAFARQVSNSAERGATGVEQFLIRLQAKNGNAKSKLYGLYDKIKKLKGQGFIEVAKELGKINPALLQKELGNVAGRFATGMIGDENVQKLIATLRNASDKNSAGAVAKEVAIYKKTLDYQYERIGKSTAGAMDSTGRVFIPVAKKVATVIENIADKVSGLAEKYPKLSKAIGFTVAILSVLAVVAGTVALAMFAISATVMLWGGAIALVVGALVELYVYWDDLIEYIGSGITEIKAWWNSWDMSDAITEVERWWNSWSVGDVLADAKAKISIAINEISQKITSIAVGIWDWLEVPEWVVTGLKLIALPFLGIMALIKWIAEKASTMWDGIVNSDIVTTAIDEIKIALNWLLEPFKKIWDYISNAINGVHEWGQSFGFVDGAIELIKSLASPIKWVADQISNLMKKFNVVSNIKNKMSGWGDAIGGAFDSLTNYVAGDSENKQDTARDKSNSLSETNINKNKSMQAVDIMVRAEAGTSAVAHHKENGNTRKLRTVRNRTEEQGG